MEFIGTRTSTVPYTLAGAGAGAAGAAGAGADACETTLWPVLIVTASCPTPC